MKSRPSSAPQPPKGLSAEARAFWKRLRDEYGIRDAGGLALLEIAARAFARLDEARRLLDREGSVVKDRWGQAKAHPAAALERDSRAGLMAALRALQLDVEPLRERPGRPGGR